MAGGFRYVLQSTDGESLGEFVTAVPDWRVGESFQNHEGRRFRILEIVAFLEEDAVYSAMWKVQELGGDAPEESNGHQDEFRPKPLDTI